MASVQRKHEEVTRVVPRQAIPAAARPTQSRPIESPPNPMAPVVRSTTSPRSPYTVPRAPQPPASSSQPQPQAPRSQPQPQPHAARPVGEDTVRTTAVEDNSVGDDTTQTTAVQPAVRPSRGDETTRTHAAPPPPKKNAAPPDGGTPQRRMSARTVIPVPDLPSMDQTQPAMRLEPVVRSRPVPPPPLVPQEARAQAPRRFPRGTDQHPPLEAAPLPPAPRLADEPRPANDDGPLPRVTKRLANH